MSPEDRQRAYLMGDCTENECVLCNTMPALRRDGQRHAGIPSRFPPCPTHPEAVVDYYGCRRCDGGWP